MTKLRYILTLLAVMLMTVGNVWGINQVAGVYQIGSAQDLRDFATLVNGGTTGANAVLTQDIDLGGEVEFPNIGKTYTGTFDGQGYTISGFLRSTNANTNNAAFFNTTNNATIKRFTLKGEMVCTGLTSQWGIASVVGNAQGSTEILDVTSSVKMTFKNCTIGTGSSGLRIVGGLVGRAAGTINRCRFNGTMDFSQSEGFGDRIGGICANPNGVTISNCLFDGTIITNCTKDLHKVGGIVGVINSGTNPVKNCLSVGTFTFAAGAKTTNCGAIFGVSADCSACYYISSYGGGAKSGATAVGSTPWADITNTLNNNAVVGETANWKIVEGQDYPIPMEYTIEAAGPYTITFDTKGGTEIEPIVGDYGAAVTAPANPTKTGYVFAGWDREIPTTIPGANITITAQWTYTPIDGYYLIGTKEDFFEFADVVSTNASASAKLTADINLEEETFSGFTGYKGTFDGQGHSISGYKRTFTSGNSSLGFFNATSGATIKDFTLVGEEIYNINSACYAIGGVIGMSTNTTIEGVTSKVKMTFGANCPSGASGIRCVGGIAGRISGGSINKCRYNGTIDLSANSGICDRFGGIAGDLGAASTISNCLFDGEIKVAATSSLAMGGILGTNNGKSATIQHCLFNGKLTFPASATISNCGPISGGTGVTASDSYYDMTGFTVNGVKQAKTAVQQSGSQERTTQPWLDILVALNNGSSNWGIETETYPVPGDKAATNYTITFDSNGGSAVEAITQPEGSAITAPAAPTWTGHTFTGWSPALPATMPNGGLTVTAQWKLTKYAVKYYVDNALTYTDSVEYSTAITAHAAPAKDRYTFSGWSEIPATMPAEDVRVDGTFTYTANAEGVYEIGNREDYVNFVTATKTNAAAKGKVIADINLNNEAVEGIGSNTTPYTGTFDGQGHRITGYVRSASGSYGGMFNYVNNATIKNFSLSGTMTVGGTGQQIGSVVGCSAGTTVVEDVYSSVNVTITSTAAQVGGFVGRAGGTYNRCRYSGTVSSSTAYDKIGGFAGNIQVSTLTNCLFDGTITLSAENAALKTSAFVASSFGTNPHVIKNCLVNGTMDIAHPTADCGIVVGFYEMALTVNCTYYTGSGSAITGAKGTLTGGATPVGTLTWGQILVALNPTEGTDGNWEIKAGKDYPVPSRCTAAEHVHDFINGFCISGDAYEPAEQALDGRYEVDNAGKLWWLVTKVNNGTLAKNIRIRLTADIDMEGEARGSWPGFCVLGKKADNSAEDWENTAFTGTFDGQGHTISNFYQNNSSAGINRRGLFNAIYNATVRKLNINGTVYAYSNTNLQGVVVGSASGTSKIEDIHSSVNIFTNGASGCGGVVGGMENGNTALTEMNRCRYSGTITLRNNGNNNVGGLVGELRSAVMKNCLFDGTITKQEGAAYSSVGGLVGKVTNYDNSEMHRCLTHGTITLDAYNEATNTSGIVVGSAIKTLYMYRCYHTTTKVTADYPFIGPHFVDKTITNEKDGTVGAIIPYNQLMGESNDLSSNLDTLYSDGLRTLLGESNWAEVEKTTGKYTYPLKDEDHIHHYNENGFCTAGDGEYRQPNIMGNVYQIFTGGQLYWFATQFNSGNIPQDATVQIMKDIDMEGDAYMYPGIGTTKRSFKGTFDGQGNKIGRYYRDIVNAEYTGLINFAEGATIRDFSIYGTVNFNPASVKSFHGTVLGMGINEYDAAKQLVDTMLITDVYSFVDVNCSNANVRVFGGIAGRTSGGLKRSRYSGTIKGMGETASASGRQIGGICANARERILLEDCLFDGKIWITCEEADTMRVSGILASNEKNSGVKIVIKNCLFNGCLQLEHTYEQGTHGTGVKSTENGIIAGYWDSNLPKVVNNVYFLKTCPGMDSINIGNWEGKNQQAGSTVVTTEIKPEPGQTEITDEQWNEIFKELDEFNVHCDTITPDSIVCDTIRNGNWEYVVDSTSVDPYPTPGGHVCHHLDDDGNETYDQFGYCTICGKGRPLRKDEDGRFVMEYISDLASFRDMVNSATEKSEEVFNAKLTSDIDFAEFEGEFGEPIGNNYYNRYLYNFDGQGYSLLNVKITSPNNLVGFFGFAGDTTHDCHIHDFTITGEYEVPYDSKEHDDQPLCMGVVGKMFRGQIYNVHSHIVMKNTRATRANIGGILGAADTEDPDHAIRISKCSYTGTCEANAVGAIGGIIGQTSKNTQIDNCTFAGTLKHTYQGSNNKTQFGGIIGLNDEASFSGVSECVVAGILHTDPNRAFVDYGKEGNHKNVITGEDRHMNSLSDEDKAEYRSRYHHNYALASYEPLIPTNTTVKPTFLTLDHFLSGEVCAVLNACDTKPDNVQDGYPWGQVLGFQRGGYSTPGSPAMALPMPGYQNPEKIVYKVVRDTNATDKTKYDYVADFYYFDDAGDETLYPSDAASMAAKKIQYDRTSMGGFISVCMPFEVTKAMLPEGAEIYEFDKCYPEKDEQGNAVDAEHPVYVDSVNFKLCDDQTSIPAGKPVFVYVGGNTDPWNLDVNHITSGDRLPLTFAPANGKDNETVGLNAAFNTEETGIDYFKLNTGGEQLVYTKATSHVYPYRTYIKLPDGSKFRKSESSSSSAAPRVRAVFNRSTGGSTTPGLATALDQAPDQSDLPQSADTAAPIRKYFINNQLVIERAGHIYTATGMVIR